MHKCMVELDLAGLVNAACDEDFDPVLTPAQTYQKLVKHRTERLRFAEMAGRIAAVMLVPYPPASPCPCPASASAAQSSPSSNSSSPWKSSASAFPGFEREVHGIEVDGDGNYWMRAVMEDTAAPKKRRRGQTPPPTNAPALPKPRLKSKPVRRAGD